MNLILNDDSSFVYFFSISIACLFLRLVCLLQFNDSIGPLVKIVGKAQKDFLSFFILFSILAFVFSIVGNINFRTRLKAFEGLFESFLTIMNYSLGTFDFQIFKNIPDLEKRLFGQLFAIVVVFSFNMLILNMIIAVLANTYSIFDGCSKGLYLSEILITRDVLNYDQYCGAFLFTIPLISLI